MQEKQISSMKCSVNDFAESLSLDGAWDFELGGQKGSFESPGTWEAQDYPHRVDGPAHFHKQIFVPAAWHDQSIQLQFDAVSYDVEVRVNSTLVGTHRGLWTAFAFDVSEVIGPGENNTIDLTVYKPGEHFPMRESLAGFLPDVAATFGGIWQSARLVAFPSASMNDVWLRPDIATNSVAIQAVVLQAAEFSAEVTVFAPDGTPVATTDTPILGGKITTILTIPSPQYWYPNHPACYTAEISLKNDQGVQARVGRTFAFRMLSRQNEQLLLNGDPIFLRGVLNWGWYPKILCPAPDEATIRDEFRRIREYGYNMVKLCLYVPSPLYFEIADQEGMLLWLELPLWLPQVTLRLRKQVLLEYADILAQVHHHPSIVIYSLGCELGDAADEELLGKLNTIVRSGTSGVLVCDNSGSGEAYGGLAFDYADFNDYHFYCDLHYFTPLIDHFRRDWRPIRPWIFGEFCDADDYRDLDEIKDHFGGSLPWWYTEQNPVHLLSAIAYSQQESRMANLTLGFSQQDLQRISRQQSFVVRKTILEKARSRGAMGGYVVTGLRETPLATSSMFDDLGRAKYPAASFRQFNDDAVLILEQGRARVWKHGGDRPAPLDKCNVQAGTEINLRIVLANADREIPGGELIWTLADSQGNNIANGSFQVDSMPPSSTPHEIAAIHFGAPQLDWAQQYTLSAELSGATRNDWPLWVYPAVSSWPGRIAMYDPSGVLDKFNGVINGAQHMSRPSDFNMIDDHLLVSSIYSQDVYDHVWCGGRAIILQAGAGTLPAVPCPFWRESIKLLYDHPILKSFPHDGFVDLQFYNLASDHALNTAQIQAAIPNISRIKSIVRRLDARQFTTLDYLIELEIGAGKLLVSTLRFQGSSGEQTPDFKSSIVRQYLLKQLLAYLTE
jgi:hypothetical protein